jgi:hypothetical protein
MVGHDPAVRIAWLWFRIALTMIFTIASHANRSHAAVLYGKHGPCLSVLADPARGVWPLTKRTIGGRSTPAQLSH